MAYAQSPITLPTNYGTRKHKTQCKTLCFLAHFIEKKEETVRKSESLYSPTDSLGPSSIARNIPAPFPASSSSYIYIYSYENSMAINSDPLLSRNGLPIVSRTFKLNDAIFIYVYTKRCRPSLPQRLRSRISQLASQSFLAVTVGWLRRRQYPNILILQGEMCSTSLYLNVSRELLIFITM